LTFDLFCHFGELETGIRYLTSTVLHFATENPVEVKRFFCRNFKKNPVFCKNGTNSLTAKVALINMKVSLKTKKQ